MKCIRCNCDLEVDDNYCPKCGEMTACGYVYFKKHPNEFKDNSSLIGSLFTLTSITIISFIVMVLISGKDMFRPYIEIKKEIYSLKQGYRATLINTDNKYTNVVVDSRETAIEFIKKDLVNETWYCRRNIDVSLIEKEIEENYKIPSVSLCDVDKDTAKNIKKVIDRIYYLFPDITGYLTNITITNASNNEEYIAYFEPMYTFVNNNLDINEYNKINKTQILLNSYYYLNKDILSKGIDKELYPKGASYDTLIAHELGHYISFVTLLKDRGISDVTFITKNNNYKYEEVKEVLNSGAYSKEIVEMAVDRYNEKYDKDIAIEEFIINISKYASQKDGNNNFNYDEVIAEAIYDYYLNDGTASKCSLEIVNILKERLL